MFPGKLDGLGVVKRPTNIDVADPPEEMLNVSSGGSMEKTVGESLTMVDVSSGAVVMFSFWFVA